jgi:hypothetical protein
MTVVNWDLMKHPINWFVVVLMVLIAGVGTHFVIQHLKQSVTTTP